MAVPLYRSLEPQNVGGAAKVGYDSDGGAHLTCSLQSDEPWTVLSPLRDQTTLEDLPNEVLQQLLDHLHDGHLFEVALVSRRFNRLAIPMYLKRFGASGPSSRLLLFNYITKDILRGLFAATFTPTLHAIHYFVDWWKSGDELTREIALVTRVLHKIQGQTTMVLDFANTGPSPSTAKALDALVPEAIRKHLAYGFPPEVREATVHAFLDAVVATGCRSFVLQHCMQQKAVQGFLSGWIEGQFSGLHGLRRRLVAACPSILSAPKDRALETFNLNSPMAFHPLIIDWTLNTLNFSRITALSVVHHQVIDAQAWVDLLPHITVKALTTLTVDFVKIPPDSLVDFLHRHPPITTLRLGLHIPPPTENTILPRVSFMPKLTHVTAPREWCNFLLRPADSLPSLVSATVSVRVPCTRHQRVFSPMMSYAPSMTRLSTVEEVRLSLSFAFSSFEWLLDSPSQHSSGDPSESQDQTLGDDGSDPLTTSITDSHISDIRLAITHLDLHTTRYNLPMVLAGNISPWLFRFPVLKHLRIFTLGSPTEVAASSEGQFLTESVDSKTNVATVRFEQFQLM